jgi:hypothetical protein
MGFAMFIFGAAVGTAASWRFAKQKYERIAQDEIDSVKLVFARRKADANRDAREKAKEAKKKLDISEYASRLSGHGYTNYSNADAENIDLRSIKEREGTEEMEKDRPAVIAPDEFGEIDDYEKISLTYFADKVLADENDEPIENADEVVGPVSLKSFGEYEDDSVFVRSDRLKCYYEILLDQRKYSDVAKKKPREVK